MKRTKQIKQNLEHLLFSSFGDGSHCHSPQQSNLFNQDQNQMQDGDQQFALNIPQEDKSSQNNDSIQFFKLEGPCVQFSQHFSQSSISMSHRNDDDDSPDYKNNSKIQLIFRGKEKDKFQLSQALQQQLTKIKKQKDKIELQNSKLQNLNKDLQGRIKQKQKNIELLQEEISNFQVQMQKLKEQNDQYLKAQMHRSSCLQQYKKQSEKILAQLAQKQKENHLLKSDIRYLESEIEKISNFNKHNNSDRILKDGNNLYSSQHQESPLLMKKNLSLDREFQKIRRQKNNLQVQLCTIKDKLEDREVRSKQIQEQNKKKIQLKQKRISQLQQKINQLKEEQIKLKTQNEVSTQKLNNSINLKSKEILALNQKINESQKRINSLFQETKRKDEKIKQMTLQLLEKNKLIIQKDKNLKDMKVQLDFDHQMIDDKDKEIEKLLGENSKLKLDLQNFQKLQKNDTTQKNQKQRLKRQMDKVKKELQLSKSKIEASEKEIQQLTKQNQKLSNATKQNKKKLEQASKKIQLMRNSNSHIEEQTRKKQEESAKQQQPYNKVMKQLNDYKKKSQSVVQLKNKIILLESRLKAQSESQTGQSFESTLQNRIDLLQHKLQERDKQNRALKTKLKNQAKNSEVQMKELEEQIEIREHQVQKLLKQNEDLKAQVAFRDQTLHFTHKKLISSQKAKIQLEQQKKMLEEMIHAQREDILDGTNQEITKFYQEKLQQLQQMLKKKEQQHRFQIKQLKEKAREREINGLNKQRKTTPQAMSPEDTVNFLIKTIKKVNKSADMVRILSKNLQFREALIRMDRQFKK